MAGIKILSKVFFVFTDEAGVYNKRPTEKFRRSQPFYIRSNICFSIEDYKSFQNEIQELNNRYHIPVGEEIKWSDLWEIHNGKYRADFLKKYKEDTLKGYYRSVLKLASRKKSFYLLYTVTCIFTQACYQSEEEMLKFHLQEAMQRFNMDAQPDGFSTIIMDELNLEKIKKLKTACHEIAVKGDFIKKYKNIYSGILTESSSQSAGIQLADFAAGIMNGYLRATLLNRGKYEFAMDLFTDYIQPNLRHHSDGRIMGFGIREVPSDTNIRNKLSALFEN